MELINKDTVVAKIKKRFDDYSNSILRHYDACTEARASELGKILVILNTLEVKEVDLKKEVDSQTDLLCNLLCYMDELSNGDSEGVYPLPENVIEDLRRFAKHFYELGFNAQKEERTGR